VIREGWQYASRARARLGGRNPRSAAGTAEPRCNLPPRISALSLLMSAVCLLSDEESRQNRWGFPVMRNRLGLGLARPADSNPSPPSP